MARHLANWGASDRRAELDIESIITSRSVREEPERKFNIDLDRFRNGFFVEERGRST